MLKPWREAAHNCAAANKVLIRRMMPGAKDVIAFTCGKMGSEMKMELMPTTSTLIGFWRGYRSLSLPTW